MRCVTLKEPQCSMGMSAGYWSNLTTLNRQWRRLHISESSCVKTPNNYEKYEKFRHVSTTTEVKRSVLTKYTCKNQRDYG